MALAVCTRIARLAGLVVRMFYDCCNRFEPTLGVEERITMLSVFNVMAMLMNNNLLIMRHFRYVSFFMFC